MFFWCPSVCRLKLWHRTTARVGINLVSVVFLAGTVHLKYNQIDAAAAPCSQSTWSQDGWNWMKQIARDLGGFLHLYSMPLRNMMKGNLTILTVVGACLVHYLRSAARPNLIDFAWPYLGYAWSHQPPTKLSTLMNCCSRWSTLFSHCIGDALR